MSINEYKKEIERIEKIREEKVNKYIIPLEIKLAFLREGLEKLEEYFRDEMIMDAIDNSLNKSE